MKQRRRTLKNRAYAQTCRSKKVSTKEDLEEVNDNLYGELEALVDQLNEVKRERDQIKLQLERIKGRGQEPCLKTLKIEIEETEL